MARREWMAMAMFVGALWLLTFGYGYLARDRGLFPDRMIRDAVKAAKSLYADARGELPWYYVRQAFPLSGPVTVRGAAACEGVTLVTCMGPDSRLLGRLVDLDGRVRHAWDLDWFRLWPEASHLPPALRPRRRPGTCIHGALLAPNGDLVFNFSRLGLVRLSPRGDVVWRVPRLTHHTVEQDGEGNFWVPSQRYHTEPDPARPNLRAPFRESTMLKISPAGDVVRDISLFDVLESNGLEGLLYMAARGNSTSHVSGDILHLNDVEPFPSDMVEGFFRRGDLLVSLRNIHTVLVLDADLKIRLRLTGCFVRQHDPDFIDGNTLSVFDNRNMECGTGRKASRILRFRAPDFVPEVCFEGGDEVPFFTAIMGKHSWLPNGHLLVIESMNGRTIEVDQQGRLVWEYWNLVDKNTTGAIGDVLRLPSNDPGVVAILGARWHDERMHGGIDNTDRRQRPSSQALSAATACTEAFSYDCCGGKGRGHHARY